MTNLQKKLIKLAHSHPEFRKDLLPLLKKGSEGKTSARTKQATFGKSISRAIEEVTKGAERNGYVITDEARQREYLQALKDDAAAVQGAMKNLIQSAQKGKFDPNGMWVDVAGQNFNDFFWDIVVLNRYNQQR